jgi:hypothetical protein
MDKCKHSPIESPSTEFCSVQVKLHSLLHFIIHVLAVSNEPSNVKFVMDIDLKDSCEFHIKFFLYV